MYTKNIWLTIFSSIQFHPYTKYACVLRCQEGETLTSFCVSCKRAAESAEPIRIVKKYVENIARTSCDKKSCNPSKIFEGNPKTRFVHCLVRDNLWFIDRFEEQRQTAVLLSTTKILKKRCEINFFLKNFQDNRPHTLHANRLVPNRGSRKLKT